MTSCLPVIVRRCARKSRGAARTIGNRWAIHPMEGWDGTTSGGVTEPMVRRWQRFGESGAKLIWGGEAMAVRPDGRANPRQLILNRENQAGIASLRETLLKTHREKFGTTDDLVIGFQLTHSGRFCRPHSKQWESRIAYRHPLLDAKFNVTSDAQILQRRGTAPACRGLRQAAARIAAEIGADFVDIKHCHGYLLHEFLGAHTRPGALRRLVREPHAPAARDRGRHSRRGAGTGHRRPPERLRYRPVQARPLAVATGQARAGHAGGFLESACLIATASASTRTTRSSTTCGRRSNSCSAGRSRYRRSSIFPRAAPIIIRTSSGPRPTRPPTATSRTRTRSFPSCGSSRSSRN